VSVEAGSSYVEITIGGRSYLFDRDAQFWVERGGKMMKVYADRLREGDDIRFDRRDVLWNLNGR